jgi:hypothetical protein
VGFGLYNSSIFEKLTDSSYARGVITYLITIATIGLVFVLVLQIMFVRDEDQERVKGAREILTVLTGILGTIVGFYFGQTSGQTNALRVAHLTIDPVVDGKERVSAFVEGGVPPYNYVLSFEGDDGGPNTKSGQSSSGIIAVDLETTTPKDVDVSVVDAHNNKDERREAAPAPSTPNNSGSAPPSAPGSPTTTK